MGAWGGTGGGYSSPAWERGACSPAAPEQAVTGGGYSTPAWERGACSPAAPEQAAVALQGSAHHSCASVYFFTSRYPNPPGEQKRQARWLVFPRHPSHGQSDEPRRGAASILRPLWVIWVILISYSERRTFLFFFQRTQAFFFSKEQLNAFLL